MTGALSDEAGDDLGRRIVIIAVALLALAALIGPAVLILRGGRSSAAFGDNETIGANHLGAATLDIEIGATTTRLVGDLMAPGTVAVGWLDLANRGDLSLRYSIIADNGDDLLVNWLRWDVWVTTSSCGPPDAARLLVHGAVLTPGGSDPLLGNALPGIDAGDRVLDPDDTERVCVAATLADDAPNTVQGRSVDQELRVAAEHNLVAADG